MPFYLGTSLAVIVLRLKEPHIERPYRVTGYPVTTLIFCAVCVLLICSCGSYALATRRASIFVLLSVLVAGMIVYWLTDIRSSARGKQN